ncbi:2OG-Fe dioxygenase family protein [Chromobacterium paludis]|uniref:2OG-Fe dioxygenase family protein n=2 Tax=Chromobacterium paludis TaxID=2605945 RepID=A0A5C1DM11_9NEIS|nr:2OG-Fe dioxygenase family protein [Chromobacterium paludis]
MIDDLCNTISRDDFLFIDGLDVMTLLKQQNPKALTDQDAFIKSWSELGQDHYMADGGTYRFRRHATFSAQAGADTFHIEPHQPHYQTLHYNPLNGGIARHFLPIAEDILRGATLGSLIQLGCDLFSSLAPYNNWHIEVHQFRISPQEDGVGKPTPEGVHRDGVSYVMMLMVNRENIVDGQTTIYDLNKTPVSGFTLSRPFDLAIVNDEHVFHGVTPIQKQDAAHPANRDVLVVTFKRRTHA